MWPSANKIEAKTVKIQRCRMPPGPRRAEHAQGCGEWIPFCSRGGPVLLRFCRRCYSHVWLEKPTHGVCHGVICLSIYPSFLHFLLLSQRQEQIKLCVCVYRFWTYYEDEAHSFYDLLLNVWASFRVSRSAEVSCPPIAGWLTLKWLSQLSPSRTCTHTRIHTCRFTSPRHISL